MLDCKTEREAVNLSVKEKHNNNHIYSLKLYYFKTILHLMLEMCFPNTKNKSVCVCFYSPHLLYVLWAAGGEDCEGLY